jgi:hypothetical protein
MPADDGLWAARLRDAVSSEARFGRERPRTNDRTA